MKRKIIVLMLTAAMALFVFTGCGSSDTGSSSAGSEAAAETEASGTDSGYTFESKEVADNDEVSIVITDIDDNGGILSDLSLTVEFENKSSDVTYMYSVETAYINGVECDPLFADTVAPEKNAVDTISFTMSSLLEESIEKVTDIELTFLVYDDDDWEADYVVDKTVHVYPYGKDAAETFVRESQDGDNVIVDNDNVSMTVIGYEYDSTWGYGVQVYFTNSTDSEVMFAVEDASVNGTMADPFWASDIGGGKSGFSTIYFYDDTLEEIGITDPESEIEEIAFTLSAYDEDSFDSYAEKEVTLNP